SPGRCTDPGARARSRVRPRASRGTPAIRSRSRPHPLRSPRNGTLAELADQGGAMVTVGVLAQLEAKPGKEEEVARFLEGALPLAQQEEATTAWFAIRMGPSTFGIFDVSPDEPGREAHLAGPIAAALMQRADELLTEPPMIEKVDVLASKLSE